ncbi:MAG: rhomboid family intramembrane serine protease [Lactovum sp.]
MRYLEQNYNPKHRGCYAILAITSLVWLLQIFTFKGELATGENLLKSGALWGFQIINNPGQIWRLVTPIFVHLNWSHFLMNMLSVFVMGRLIEEEFGTARFLEIYFLSGIFANTMVFFLSTSTLSAGASTSIFGIFGAMGTLGYYTESPRLKEIGKSFLVLVILNLLLNIFQPNVSIVGHIGGVLGGALFAGAWPPENYKKWVPKNTQIICSLLLLLLFVLFISLTFTRY